jgi:hypothetical protein
VHTALCSTRLWCLLGSPSDLQHRSSLAGTSLGRWRAPGRSSLRGTQGTLRGPRLTLWRGIGPLGKESRRCSRSRPGTQPPRCKAEVWRSLEGRTIQLGKRGSCSPTRLPCLGCRFLRRRGRLSPCHRRGSSSGLRGIASGQASECLSHPGRGIRQCRAGRSRGGQFRLVRTFPSRKCCQRVRAGQLGLGGTSLDQSEPMSRSQRWLDREGTWPGQLCSSRSLEGTLPGVSFDLDSSDLSGTACMPLVRCLCSFQEGREPRFGPLQRC